MFSVFSCVYFSQDRLQIGSLYLVLFVCFLLVVNTSASDCLERLVPEMIYYVLRGTLNSAYSLWFSPPSNLL